MTECIRCGCKTVFVLSYLHHSAVCTGCRSLLTIDGPIVRLVTEDAAKRFPSMLQWWDSRNNIMTEDIENTLLL